MLRMEKKYSQANPLFDRQKNKNKYGMFEIKDSNGINGRCYDNKMKWIHRTII